MAPSPSTQAQPVTAQAQSKLYTTTSLLLASVLLRIVFLLWGIYQDATSPFKYTDIDYYVFTDASRYISHNASPYDRATYRYTPLLAWLLLPTSYPGFFTFGKILFAAGDILAGWLMIKMGVEKRYACIWLLNPMVATISTRGSSEGLLGVMVVGLLWSVLQRRVIVSGVLLGLAVHFKIYPFIYAPAVVWWMEPQTKEADGARTVAEKLRGFVTMDRVVLAVVSLVTFGGLNAGMYAMYGQEFIQHTFLHHISRVDHRHNFSPYNILLYNSSTTPVSSLAFLPQLFLSAIAIPLASAKYDLPTTMFAQTFAFVTFNKVCTSQYFMWYLVLLPFYIPRSSLVSERKVKGCVALGLWVVAQGLWLQQGYMLEFLGISTFFPGMWLASLFFFAVNCWILGLVVDDIQDTRVTKAKKTI